MMGTPINHADAKNKLKDSAKISSFSTNSQMKKEQF